MPRLARAVAVGFAHHITQRGNNRQDVFFVDDDRRVYLELLKEQADKYSLELVGYCLMSNHTHIVAIPNEQDSLAKAIGRTHFRYTQYINRFHRRSGHLWQGRFYSCALDDYAASRGDGNGAVRRHIAAAMIHRGFLTCPAGRSRWMRTAGASCWLVAMMSSSLQGFVCVPVAGGLWAVTSS